MNKKWYLIPLTLVLVLSLFATTAFTAAKPGGGGGKVTWTPSRVELNALPGQTVVANVTFVASGPLTNVTFRVVPEGRTWITLTPSSFASVAAGATNAVTVTFVVPAGADEDTYAGVIQVKAEGKNVAKPLKYKITLPHHDEGDTDGD